MADPYAWRYESLYFAIGTGLAEADGSVGTSSTEPVIFPLLKASDLIHWRSIGRALTRTTYFLDASLNLGRSLPAPAGHADQAC